MKRKHQGQGEVGKRKREEEDTYVQYVLRCGVRTSMMVYGMVSMVRYGKVDIMYLSWYNMLGTNELRTSWINPNPTGRFSEFGGFRPVIYRIQGFQNRDLRELLPDGRTPSCRQRTYSMQTSHLSWLMGKIISSHSLNSFLKAVLLRIIVSNYVLEDLYYVLTSLYVRIRK